MLVVSVELVMESDEDPDDDEMFDLDAFLQQWEEYEEEEEDTSPGAEMRAEVFRRHELAKMKNNPGSSDGDQVEAARSIASASKENPMCGPCCELIDDDDAWELWETQEGCW